jgi:hypothetical protein
MTRAWPSDEFESASVRQSKAGSHWMEGMEREMAVDGSQEQHVIAMGAPVRCVMGAEDVQAEEAHRCARKVEVEADSVSYSVCSRTQPLKAAAVVRTVGRRGIAEAIAGPPDEQITTSPAPLPLLLRSVSSNDTSGRDMRRVQPLLLQCLW